MSKGYFAGFTGPDTTRKPGLNLDADVKGRLADMDFEGVDVNFMLPSGPWGAFTEHPDVSVEMEMFRAYHRWLEDYCSAAPDRLGAAILASGRDVKGSVEEIKKWGKSRNWCPYYLIHRAINRQVVYSGLQQRRQGWLKCKW